MAKKQQDKQTIAVADESATLALNELTAFAKADRDIQKRTQGQTQHMHAICRDAAKHAKGPQARGEYFAAACALAEVQFKAKHKITGQLREVLPSWGALKSKVLRIYKAGIDVADFETVYQAEAAREAKANADKPQDAKTNARPAGNPPAGVGDEPAKASESPSVKIGSQELANVLKRVATLVGELSTAEQTDLGEALERTVAAFMKRRADKAVRAANAAGQKGNQPVKGGEAQAAAA